MKSNFDFLSKDFPVLANFGKLAEQYCYSDANSCLIKLGMIGETIVNLMFTYDGIALPYENTAITRINTLMREGLLPRDLCDILHAIRKARNKATHENYGSVDEGKTLLQMTYSLCEWFMQTYGDWNYKNQQFVTPVVENWEYEQIETYLNTDKTEDKGNYFYQCVYIYVACIMSYKHKYTSLMFFSDFMEKEKEKIENYQEKIDAFIFDFEEAVGIYCKFLLNRKMLSFSNANLEEIAKEFLSNVARCSRKNTNIARYSEDFVM